MKKKLGKPLGFDFDRNLMEFFLGTSDFDEIWVMYSCLHIDDNLTHERSFKVQIRISLTWS
jgi:hypothetical protein